MQVVLVVLLILLIFGGLPQVSGGWHGYGYGISGVGGVILLVLVVLLLMGRI
jgi:Protein of unknown function (DUF3309)